MFDFRSQQSKKSFKRQITSEALLQRQPQQQHQRQQQQQQQQRPSFQKRTKQIFQTDMLI